MSSLPRVARLSEWKMTTRGQRVFADSGIIVVCGVYVAWIKTGYTITLLMYHTVSIGYLLPVVDVNVMILKLGVSSGDFWKVFVR